MKYTIKYTYKGIYKGKTAEVTTIDGKLEAERRLAKILGAKKPWEITCCLVARDNKPINNRADF